MVSSTQCRQPSAFELVSLDYDVCCMGFKMPRWVNPVLPLTCMNPNFYAGYTLLTFRQMSLQYYNLPDSEK